MLSAFETSNHCGFELQTWPSDALEMVANKFLEEVELEDAVRAGVVFMCKMFHESVFSLSDK